MKASHAHKLEDEEDDDPLRMSAARFAPTPLGRAILHLECLCHHPAAARFYFDGLKRNLRESAASAKQSTSKLLRNALSHCMKNYQWGVHPMEINHANA